MLERWGVWARDNDSVDYPPIAAGFKGLLPQSGKSRHSCCDDDGLVIDACVARLKKLRDEREFTVIVAHYILGISKSSIARKWKCSEGKVRQILMVAEGFIEGCLAMTGATLEMDAWAHKEKISAVA